MLIAATHPPGSGARPSAWTIPGGTGGIDEDAGRHLIPPGPPRIFDAGRPRRAALARFSVRARHGGGEADILDVPGRLIQREDVS